MLRMAFCALLGLLACPAIAAASPQVDTFYTPQVHELPGRPGSVIRSELLIPPPGAAAAHRVLYRSTGLHGEPIAVSGLVILPNGPAGPRPVIAWAHPTTGVARHCAPSLHPSPYQDITGLPDMLARGYIVAATDYPGLGTPGTHPYLIGVSAGRAVLDSVRAAREIAGGQSSAHFATWGFSQGGHASLFAGQLAHSYAPELTLVAVAAAAPPTELGTIIRTDVTGRAGKVLSSFALWSWSRLHNFPVETVLNPSMTLVLEKIAGDCSSTANEQLALGLAEAPMEREGFLIADVSVTQPWRTLIEGNSTGPQPKGVPVFIAQGTGDALVQHTVTELYGNILCSHGTPLTLMMVPNADHHDTPLKAARPAISWLANRFAGERPPDDCKP